MSAESLAIALNHSRAKGTAKLILIGIANHDGDGGAWPSMEKLAKYANVNERNAQKAVAILQGYGEIRVVEQGGGNGQTPRYRRPNLYHFLLSCPPYCDGSRQHRDTRKAAAYVPNYLETMGDDDWQPGLSSGVSETSPGVGDVTGGVSETSPQGVSHATPEPVLKKPAIEHSSGPERNAGTRADSQSAYAAEIARRQGPRPRRVADRPIAVVLPPARPPCAKHRFLPCTYDVATHLCVDCGEPDPQHLDTTTGAIA